jgi:hypothetical protein
MTPSVAEDGLILQPHLLPLEITGHGVGVRWPVR